MQPSSWAADTATYVSAGPLQPSRLPPCTPHRRRTAGAMSPCYMAMTVGEEGAPPARRGNLGAARWLLTPPSDQGGTSPPRPEENEAATIGVRHRVCRHPVGIRIRKGSPCQPPTASVGSPRYGVKQDDPLQDHVGQDTRSTEEQQMAAHSRRTPPVSAAPGQDAPGASPLVFSLTGKMPRGPHSVRRDGRTRHRKTAAGWVLPLPNPQYRVSARSTDKRPFNGKPI
jgi:hypothetical protein